MRSSRWDAQGNIYLVTEESQTPESVRADVGDTDGMHRGIPLRRRLARDRDLEPRRIAGGDVGQRHAHRGTVARGADRRLTSDRARRAACGCSAHAGRQARRAGSRRGRRVASRRKWTVCASPRSTSATRTRSSTAIRPTCLRIGPLLEVHERFPQPDERAGRASERRRRDRGARLGARSGGDGVVGLERGRRRGGLRYLAGDDALPRRRRCTCGSRERGRS